MKTCILFCILAALLVPSQAEDSLGWQILDSSVPRRPSFPNPADTERYLLRTGISDDASWHSLSNADAQLMLDTLREAQPWPIQLRSRDTRFSLTAVGRGGKRVQIDFDVAYDQCFVTIDWTVYRLSDSGFAALRKRFKMQ